MIDQKSYLEHERKLYDGHVNRAAALFPYWINENNETHVVFQNYWHWKRGINVIMRLTIYNDVSKPFVVLNEKVTKSNFDLKISNFIDRKVKENMRGMVQLEIFSSKDDNIVFPFPAVMVYYGNGNGEYSCVHSAGRTLENEILGEEKFDETNFYCKLNNEITPFIHLFTGSNSYIKDISIEIFSIKNELVQILKIPDLTKNYQSEIIYLNDYLNTTQKKFLNKLPRFFLKIKGTSKGIFPRFIVGNYSKFKKMHYVTHSFRNVKENDFITCEDQYQIKYLSSIALTTPPNITLRSIIYPTCGDEIAVDAIKFENIKNRTSLYKTSKEKIKLNIGSIGGKIQINEIQNNSSTGLLTLKSSQVPSRINCGLEFFSKKSYHPTDIALQLRPVFFRKKSNFWGHIDVFKDYKTYLLISNFLPNLSKIECHIKIKIITNELLIQEKEFYIKPGNCECIDLKKEFSKIFLSNKLKDKFIAWRAEVLHGEVQDIYILSYNKKTGSIFGDHAF